MRTLLFALLLSSSFLLAQDSTSDNPNQHNSKDSKGQVTLQGCVSRSSGDYILMKQNPAITYQLQATGKIRLQQLPGTTSGSNRERVPDHEHKFRRDE